MKINNYKIGNICVLVLFDVDLLIGLCTCPSSDAENLHGLLSHPCMHGQGYVNTNTPWSHPSQQAI